jgi:hypothetical protein
LSFQSVDQVKDGIYKQVSEVIQWILTCKAIDFLTFENQLLPRVYDLGKLFILHDYRLNIND